MNIPEFSLKNKYTTWAITIAVVIFGTLAYITLPIQLFPETAPPLVNILTPYPGAAAQDVSDLVSEVIEEEVASLEGVYRVSTTSQDGLSLVAVEFDYDMSVDLAAVDVQNAISRIRSNLPQEISEPQVLKFSTSDRPVLTVGLAGPNLVEIRRLADDVLSPEIQRVTGVALVDVFGGYVPEISIEIDRDRLEAHHVPISSVVNAIRSSNISVPAGQIRSEGRQYTFRIDEQSGTLDDIGRIPLVTPHGEQILVKDVARVKGGSGEDLSRFRVNGNAAIAMQVFKQDDANTVDVVNLVRETLQEIEVRYPDIQVMEAEESASFTQQVVDNMLSSVWQALLLASIVIFLFLGSMRRGLVVAISMPMSFAITFAVMYGLNIQLDLVTLTAIILAVGMVVDASVVILENITRHHEEEQLNPERAALTGASEIQFAIIAGVATTLIVLIPLLFLYGFTGKVFKPLAMTLIITFSASIIVALGLVPILTILVSGKGGKVERLAAKITAPWSWMMTRLRGIYMWLLKKTLRARWTVYIIAALLFVAGLVLLRHQGMELLPTMDSGSSTVTIETPSGSSLDETEQVVRAVEHVIMNEAHVERIATQIGFEPGMHSFGSAGVQGPTQGSISVTFSPRTEREESIWNIQNRIRDNIGKIPGIQNFVVRESGSTARATTASSITIKIKGEDPLILDRLGDEILSKISTIPGVTNPYRSWRRDQRSIVLSIDAGRTREMGLTPATVAQEMVRSLDGVPAGIYRGKTGEDTPIRVRYAAQFRSNRENIFEIRTFSNSDGMIIPLSSMVISRDTYVQGLVTRENLEPTLQVLALHHGRPLSFVSADVGSAISSIEVPRGYTVAMEGENKDMSESRDELLGALVIAVIAIYLLLVAQFKSFVHPLTVMMSIPLSLVGVSIALWIAGKPVSMPVMVGLILLVGIVVNNSIILIDFINQKREGGMDRREAILSSVNTRFRPIMMTSFSTIVGMIPLAFEWALGAERFSPLAIAVIGGMTASTFLTMIVIPVLYDTLDTVMVKLRKE